MAENETLDLDGSPRWRRVFRAVDEGKPADIVARVVVESLFRTLRRVQKQIPLNLLLLAAESQPEQVGPLIRQCKGHDYAVLFGEVLEPSVTREHVARNFVQAILEKFSDQIICRAVPSQRWPQMHEVVDFMHEIGNRLLPDVDRIARNWAADPQWKPVMTRTSNTSATLVDKTETILGESLLKLGMQ